MESIWITGKCFWELRLIHPEIIIKKFNLTRCKDYSHKLRQTKLRHNSNADMCDMCDKTVDYEFYNTSGITAVLHSRTAKTANIGIAIRQFRLSTIVFSVEISIQSLSDYLFFSRCWTRRLLLLWTRASRIPTSRRTSASSSRKPKKRTSFYDEDRSRTWSTTTFEWLALMIQYWTLLIFALLLFMMTTFRTSIQDGTKFCCRCQKFHPMRSWKVCTNWGYMSLINSKPY